MKKLSMEELGRPSLDQYQDVAKKPVVIVLDNVRSMHNVGSAFRTADGFAISKIYLCGITAQPPHRDIHKTALGATESVEWAYYKETADALRSLKDEGYQITLVEQTDEAIMLDQFSPAPADRLAFVFGHEVFGVSDPCLPLADQALEIPQYGTKHSLNVSVTVGIVLWHWLLKTSGHQ